MWKALSRPSSKASHGCTSHKRSTFVHSPLRRVMQSSKVKKPSPPAAVRKRKAKALGALRDEGYESCSERIQSVAVDSALGPDPKHSECLDFDVKRLMEQIYFEINEAKYWTHTLDEFDKMGNEEVRHTLTFFRVIEAAVAFLENPTDPTSSAVMDVVGSDFPGLSNAIRIPPSSFNSFVCGRYAGVLNHYDWSLLLVLANSEAFRNAALMLDPRAWAELIECAIHNALSLDTFAKVRGLDMTYALKRVLDFVPSDAHEAAVRYLQHAERTLTLLQKEHAYVIAQSKGRVYRPKFQGHHQVDIPYNLYDEAIFTKGGPPTSWVHGKPYPSHPFERGPGENRCISCLGEGPCSCDMSTSELVHRPLVELREYPDKGVGVRALQRIPAGTILDEYVGTIMSVKYQGDPVYAYSAMLYDGVDDEFIATISAKRYGNWTRYINHSCKPSTQFKERTLGDKHRVLVCAIRDIEMFEEILIDYGKDYWQNRDCLCGESNCCTMEKAQKLAEAEQLFKRFKRR